MYPRLNDAGLTKANSWQSSANRTEGSRLFRRAGRALGCHRCAVRGSPVGSAVCPSGEPSQELGPGPEVPKRSGVRYMVRRSLSFLLASALLLAGVALAGFEITHAEALRPFMLIGALVIIGAAGLWLVDEFGGWLLRR